MNKVYILIQDYAIQFDTELRIKAYKSMDGAKKAFRTAVEESKKIDKVNNFEVFDDTETSYTAYIDGEETENHSRIYIEEVEVEN